MEREWGRVMDGASWFSKPGKNLNFFAARGAGALQNFKFDFQSFSCSSVILNMSYCPQSLSTICNDQSL